MIPVDTLMTSELRASLRAQFAAAPLPPQANVDELTDLTFLAVREALEAIERVAGRGSVFGARIAIHTAALPLAAALMNRIHSAMLQVGDELGGRLMPLTVSVARGES